MRISFNAIIKILLVFECFEQSWHQSTEVAKQAEAEAIEREKQEQIERETREKAAAEVARLKLTSP